MPFLCYFIKKLLENLGLCYGRLSNFSRMPRRSINTVFKFERFFIAEVEVYGAINRSYLI